MLDASIWGYILIWHVASGLNGVSSKEILNEIQCPFTLSAMQLSVAYFIHWIVQIYLGSDVEQQKTTFSRDEKIGLNVAGLLLAIGITCVNGGFRAMHVSINETLCALETLVVVSFSQLASKEHGVSRYVLQIISDKNQT